MWKHQYITIDSKVEMWWNTSPLFHLFSNYEKFYYPPLREAGPEKFPVLALVFPFPWKGTSSERAPQTKPFSILRPCEKVKHVETPAPFH
ncbi:hypothetical protein AVEN_156512-1 [Araneus ventricosus]|uniref:Uncharacterized protein n=1 Tax=Araneus ventricosus TaxID=182803 RepID=A0A4Y2VBM5_ARAVE|nr:hypothetical protein AVEN_156512-1 [Araneus ventricosus]